MLRTTLTISLFSFTAPDQELKERMSRATGENAASLVPQGPNLPGPQGQCSIDDTA
jgi:hypothetical protein